MFLKILLSCLLSPPPQQSWGVGALLLGFLTKDKEENRAQRGKSSPGSHSGSEVDPKVCFIQGLEGTKEAAMGSEDVPTLYHIPNPFGLQLWPRRGRVLFTLLQSQNSHFTDEDADQEGQLPCPGPHCYPEPGPRVQVEAVLLQER